MPQNSKTTKIATKANDLGGPEALGAMLRLARIEVTDDSLSPAAYARFEAEGADIMDMLQNLYLNWSVVLALFLTIYVSMAVMHTGSSAYASGAAIQRLAFAANGDDLNVEAFGDLASFACPDDELAAAKLRRGLYIGECVCIACGVAGCLSGLVNALVIYSGFGAALPDALSKFEFIFDSLQSMAQLWAVFDGNLFFLPCAVAFATSRASAIMSLALWSAFAVSLVMMFLLMTRGSVSTLHHAQLRQAKFVLSLWQEEEKPQAGRGDAVSEQGGLSYCGYATAVANCVIS